MGGMMGGGFWMVLIPGIFVALGILGWSFYSRNRRRELADSSRPPTFQDQVFQIAMRKDGLVTVTDVAAETGVSFKIAEEQLKEMVDFSRVNMRVSDAGLMVYEFVELRKKDPGNSKSLTDLGV